MFKRDPFKITDEEYVLLDQKFGNLANFQSWQLLRKNTKNNHTSDFEDVVQDLRMHLVIAAKYYKRQIYIEESLLVSEKYAKDDFTRKMVKELAGLWKNRKRHGANKQKFGPYQERLLDKIVKKVVPAKERPMKKRPLKIDSKFSTYCKAICWNCQKNLGKKITREKSIRSGQVSLSEYDYLSKVE